MAKKPAQKPKAKPKASAAKKATSVPRKPVRSGMPAATTKRKPAPRAAPARLRPRKPSTANKPLRHGKPRKVRSQQLVAARDYGLTLASIQAHEARPAPVTAPGRKIRMFFVMASPNQ
jgi:hypothetical protein